MAKSVGVHTPLHCCPLRAECTSRLHAFVRAFNSTKCVECFLVSLVGSFALWIVSIFTSQLRMHRLKSFQVNRTSQPSASVYLDSVCLFAFFLFLLRFRKYFMRLVKATLSKLGGRSSDGSSNIIDDGGAGGRDDDDNSKSDVHSSMPLFMHTLMLRNVRI